jgi:hypothetical protein
MNSYELWIHYKQGDELASCLEETDQEVIPALRLWADRLERGVQHIFRLADFLENQAPDPPPVTITADTHHIGFDGPEKVLRAAVEQELLLVMDFDDPDDEELLMEDEDEELLDSDEEDDDDEDE